MQSDPLRFGTRQRQDATDRLPYGRGALLTSSHQPYQMSSGKSAPGVTKGMHDREEEVAAAVVHRPNRTGMNEIR